MLKDIIIEYVLIIDIFYKVLLINLKMKIVFSYHAQKRLKERDIKEKDVYEIVEFPDYTIKRGEEIEAYKKIEGRLIKVVYIIMQNYIKIITVYPIE